MTLPATRTGATLAEADQWETDALAAIDAVETPEAAEVLLGKIKLVDQAVRLSKLGAEREQRWGRVRMLAEKRLGELLPPAEKGGDTTGASDRLSDAEYKQRERARAVAAIPEPVFREYVENDPRPTRAGLFREAESKLLASDAGQQAASDIDYRRRVAMRDLSAAVAKTAALLPQLDHIAESALRIDPGHARDDAQRSLETWQRLIERLDGSSSIRRIK